MDHSTFLSEPTSFFALKKSIHLLNLIAKYLKNEDGLTWSDVLKYQKDTQKFVNLAVSSNFPDEHLESYKLNLPSNPDQRKLASGVFSSNQRPQSSNSGNAECNLFDSQDCDTPGLYISGRDAWGQDLDISRFKLASKVSCPSSVISTDEGSTDVGIYRESNIRDPVSEIQEVNLFESDDDVQSSGVPDVVDSLTESREKYMNLINSKSIPTLDSTIPSSMMSSRNSRLFRTDFPFSQQVDELNRTVFGFTSFRGVQLGAINAIMLGLDCFVMMATGAGKSHCYQLPSLLLNGTVVVFSPLISLVNDQIQSLRSHGIEADTLNAQTSTAEFKSVSKSLTDRNKSFLNGSILFITPEKFDKSKTVLNLLQNLHDMNRLKLFVIDEAHCVSQWGHSFRKDYRKLSNLKEKFPDVPILAITATATPDVMEDITSVLCFRNHVSLRTTINRPNLWIEVREKTKSYMDEVIQILRSTSGCGIVYCLTTGDCDKAAEKMHNNGISASVYHARMDIHDRALSQKMWKNGEVRIIVATVAFGMGIDKPDVRLILHTSAPTSILAYYQEIGRAGRDGKFSTTILWYSPRDFERHKNINEAKQGKQSNLSTEMRDFCQNRTTCRRNMILEAFGEEPSFTSCLGCDNCCLKLTSKIVDVTEEATTILNFVEECMSKRTKGILTANILSDALRGSKRDLVNKYRLTYNSYHGALKGRSQKFIFDVLQQMVKLKILKECRRRSMSFGRTVLISGSNAGKLLRGSLKVQITKYEENDQPQGLNLTQDTSQLFSQNKGESQTGETQTTMEGEESQISPKEGRKKTPRKRAKATKNDNPSNDSPIVVDSKIEWKNTFKDTKNMIDLTEDSDRSIERLYGTPIDHRGKGKAELNYSIFEGESQSQTQRKVTRSDLMSVQRNNLRRIVPGELMPSTQT